MKNLTVFGLFIFGCSNCRTLLKQESSKLKIEGFSIPFFYIFIIIPNWRLDMSE